MWEMIEKMASDRLWIYTGIAGALLGAAFLAWFKDTRMGLWAYAKFDAVLDYLVISWGWSWFKQQPSRLDQIEQRLDQLEKSKK